jgi:hypothetical protein
MNNAMEKMNFKTKEAMDAFLEENQDKDLSQKLKIYLELSSQWTNEYAPLKEMGLECFTKSLLNGYDLLLPVLENEIFEVELNYSSLKTVVDNESTGISFSFNDHGVTAIDSISIQQFEELISYGQSMLELYYQYKGESV